MIAARQRKQPLAAPPPARRRALRRSPLCGATLPEFALTFPLLLLVLLAVLQFALVVHARQVVTAAAQEGARVAATEGRTPQEGEAYAAALLRAGLGAPAATFAVAVAYEPPSGDTTIASISGTYPLTVPLPGGGVPLRATARMRTERFRPGRW
jgi:Flp pilus assembly protein TadG